MASPAARIAATMPVLERIAIKLGGQPDSFYLLRKSN